MSTLMWVILIVGISAILLVGSLLLALRTALIKSEPLALTAITVRGPSPCIKVSLELRPGQRRVVVHALSVSRHAVELLGLAPPPGFAERPYVAPSRETFEPDLEEIAERRANLTPDEITSETDRQFTEYEGILENLRRDAVLYVGRLVVGRGGKHNLAFPASEVRAVAGRILVLFRRRIGFWSYSSGQSIGFTVGPDSAGN